MSGEIGTVTADGLSLYATIQAQNKNNFWTAGDTFEAFNAAHWANYTTLEVIELTGSNGTYVADFPTGITTADEYTVVVRQKVGGSTAVTDPVVAIGTVTWSGSAAETLLSPPTLAAIQAGLPTDSSIAADVQTGLTAQGFTATRAGYMDVLNGLVAAIWSAASRTLTAFGFTPVVSGIAGTTLPAAVPSLAQMQAGLPSDSSVASDVQTGLTTQGYTAARAGYLDTLNGIVAAIWAAATRTLTAVGNSAGVTTLLSYFSGAVAPQSGDAYARLGAPAGASVSADIAGIQTKLGAPANGSVSADIAAALAALMAGIISDVVTGGTPTTTTFNGSSALSSTDNQYVKVYALFTSGVNKGIPREVTGYVGASRSVTVGAAYPAAPSDGDTYVFIGAGP